MKVFADWPFLFLLVLVGVLFLVHRRFAEPRKVRLCFSDLSVLSEMKPTWKVRLRPWLVLLRCAVVMLVILALARPRFGQTYREILTEGIDIVLTIDISGSMRAEDFKPKNRLYVAKDVVKRFIEGKSELGTNDRIGIVVFAARAYTTCPLTLDYGILLHFLEKVDFIPSEEKETAIGMAIATSVNRLRRSDAKSKVCILLTDGRNNRGTIDPMTAADIARAMNVKIYTIGVGTQGEVPYPISTAFGVKYDMIEIPLDEDVLGSIARSTGGTYFRATDAESLRSIYEQIGRMEKTEIHYRMWEQYEEKFLPLVLTAFFLLAAEWILRNTLFLKIP